MSLRPLRAQELVRPSGPGPLRAGCVPTDAPAPTLGREPPPANTVRARRLAPAPEGAHPGPQTPGTSLSLDPNPRESRPGFLPGLAPDPCPREFLPGPSPAPDPSPRGRTGSRAGEGARPDGRSVPRPPGPASSPPGMEVLDEFDREFPQSVTFCELISEEAFERQAATYTERALRRLFRSVDRNPALAERVVRKGKQAECEQRGLLSFLRAKFFHAVQGELNCCNSVGTLELHQRLQRLKRSIHRVHLYSQDAKKKRRKPKVKRPEPIVQRDRATSPCLPPTPLPPPLLPPPATTMASVVAASPPVYTMPRVFGPFPPLPNKSMEKLGVSSSQVKLNWTGLASNPKRHMVDLTPLVLNPGGFHFSYLPGSKACKLQCPGFPWTPTCSGSPNTKETLSSPLKTSIFTPPVLLKFQPMPRPNDDSEKDFGSTEFVPHDRSP
ncbi:uncharacterized protein C6orf132 [Dasypus novemcinctus]|uniref:uncharacterized protein C6orf132 n=1 Tax=Dasypus novemcinctus TaxID=9361 RepID=UPI00265E8C25|nr:uncharacterized protein C6orf132 [Dasypus novemcinctus]